MSTSTNIQFPPIKPIKSLQTQHWLVSESVFHCYDVYCSILSCFYILHFYSTHQFLAYANSYHSDLPVDSFLFADFNVQTYTYQDMVTQNMTPDMHEL